MEIEAAEQALAGTVAKFWGHSGAQLAEAPEELSKVGLAAAQERSKIGEEIRAAIASMRAAMSRKTACGRRSELLLYYLLYHPEIDFRVVRKRHAKRQFE